MHSLFQNMFYILLFLYRNMINFFVFTAKGHIMMSIPPRGRKCISINFA